MVFFSLAPRIRSLQSPPQVSAESMAAPPKGMVEGTLSSRTIGSPARAMLVILLRVSSSESDGAMRGQVRPVKMQEIRSTRRDLPEPGVFPSITPIGVSPAKA